MTRWKALVPVKAAAPRKTRLAKILSSEERDALSRRLLDHVLRVLVGCAELELVVVVSAARPAGWDGLWIGESGGGLNAALEAGAEALGGGSIAVFHGDLPLISSEDVRCLLSAAEGGCALAPDRHRTGTNALALSEYRRGVYAFGPESFRRHCETCSSEPRLVMRSGLCVDIDTPADLAVARSLDFKE